MADRLVRTARRVGTPEEALGLVERGHALAMGPRLQRLEDDHDPDFLHPGRTALVLLLDVEEARPEVLAAALCVESERAELRVSVAGVAEVLGEAVAEMVAGVPLPDAEDLAELLVTADDDVRRIALAERLDHLRHAHLWNDPVRRRKAHAGAESVYLPVAERTHPTLARRYRWWCGMFGRRYLD